MNFRKPVYVGDLVSVYANLVRIGRTSVTVHLEAWVLRRKEMRSILVTDGNFTYVSIDEPAGPVTRAYSHIDDVRANKSGLCKTVSISGDKDNAVIDWRCPAGPAGWPVTMFS